MPIILYNQEKFVKDAVESALAQDYENLQILISDDCSSDNSYEIAKNIVEKYNGPHEVILNKNELNLGLINHFNKIFYDLIGDEINYVIPQAGDDKSEPNRVNEVMNFFYEKKCSIVYSAKKIIDTNDNIIQEYSPVKRGRDIADINSFLKKGAISGPMSLHMDVFRKFDKMPLKARNEEWIWSLRGSLLSGIYFLDKPVYIYRKHDNSLSLRVKSSDEKSFIKLLIMKYKFVKNTFNNLKLVKNELELIRFRLTFKQKIYFFKHYLLPLNSILKYIIKRFNYDK